MEPWFEVLIGIVLTLLGLLYRNMYGRLTKVEDKVAEMDKTGAVLIEKLDAQSKQFDTLIHQNEKFEERFGKHIEKEDANYKAYSSSIEELRLELAKH